MRHFVFGTLVLGLNSLTYANKIIEIHTPQQIKKVQLLPIKLSSKSANEMIQNLKKPQSYLQKAFHEPSKAQLNMNGVPVLDQGMQGSCATFAVTAAIDALIGKGDYISQLCHLTLGQYLSNHSYQMSGWNGSHNDTIIHQILNHGFITKEKQNTIGCAGLHEYPLQSESIPVNEMSLEAFHELSEEIPYSESASFTYLLDFKEFTQREKTLWERLRLIKSALANGDRVTLGVILTTLDGNGSYAKFHQAEDTWVVTPEVISAIHSQDYGGHAMVITGYDDQAIATDIHGKRHQGLFTLRNSWGKDAGDEGNYYMSYEYMANLAYDLIRIRSH